MRSKLEQEQNYLDSLNVVCSRSEILSYYCAHLVMEQNCKVFNLRWKEVLPVEDTFSKTEGS